MRQNGRVSDLIDTTEMYLRTIYELVEEGIVPLRARIAERLHQSGPTVSQTVARMERDGLLTVEGDRHLELTDEGTAAGDPGDAQAPPRRAAAHRRHRARVGARPRGGVPLGARDVRDRRAPAARAARPPHRVAVRQPDPGSRRARRDRRRRGVHGRRRAAVAGGQHRGGPGAGPPHLRGDAEGRGPDERDAPGRRRCPTRPSPSSPPRRACWSAPAARPPRSSSRRPTTSSCGSSDGQVARCGEELAAARRRACTSPARRRGSRRG